MPPGRYQVVITGLQDGQEQQQVAERLAQLFKTDIGKTLPLIQKSRSVIKKNLDQAGAEKYRQALEKAGVICSIENPEEEAELPSISEPVAPPPEPPQAQPAAPRSKMTQTELGLVEPEPAKQARDSEKLQQLDQFQDANFCPKCGTIRESASAVCTQCGYDPASDRKPLPVARFVKAGIALVIVAALVWFAGMPYYRSYQKHQAILDGLNLAFETRNKIASFIQDSNFWPNQNLDAGLPAPDAISNNIVHSIRITGNGAFTVTLKAEVLGSPQTLIFKPRTLKGKLVWNCTGGTLQQEYRPKLCRSQTK